jgi:tRNA(fMet)-specific endonuclease VapC
MRFVLDTNAVIALVNNPSAGLGRRIRLEPPSEIALSAIVVHELFYGAFKGRQSARNLARIDALRFAILEFDREDARQAGVIRAHLASAGAPIGPYDVLIAGQAVARDLILVTRNITEFARVPRLQITDWENS